MKWLLYIEFIALLTSHGAKSQEQLVLQNNLVWISDENLVINPGFEDYYEKSMYFLWPDSVYNATLSSTFDYYRDNHPGNNWKIPETVFGFQEPNYQPKNHSFLGFAPLVVYADNFECDRAEYIGMTLIKPTVAGFYLLSFDYVSSDIANFWPGVLGCTFSADSTTYSDIFLSLPNFNETFIVFDTVKWNRFQVLLESDGNDKNIIIGCFNVEGVPINVYSENVWGSDNGREKYGSYVFIDNVSVRKVEKVLPLMSQEFTLFPNPSPNGQFSLAYNLPGEEPVAFVLYDAIGKRVAEEILPAGVQHVALNFPSLASGAYVWKALQQGGYVGSGKLVIGR